jgi:hypothetical protein
MPGPQQVQNSKLQHVLHLSNDPRRVFIGIEDGPESNKTLGSNEFILTSVPAHYATQYNTLLNQKLSAFWAPKLALSLNGSAWEVGTTIVYTGELRVHGGAQVVRAVLVAFETKIGDADDTSTKDLQEIIQEQASEMARIIGIENATQVWGHGDQQKIVHAWCQVLSK